jgi:WXXGXW repeat (2 copies)
MQTNRILHLADVTVRWIILAALAVFLSAASSAQVAVGISVRIGPPALPVYAQPICPGPGYIWTPGYWAWNDDGGYYWVPGTWVVAPVGMLWTPGWWGWGGGVYLWHAGYWGPHVGFYGGINYGFGYGGVGFVGGEWRGGGFYYNRSVTNVSVTNVTNVYNKTVVVNNTTVNNVSYNGGSGGVEAHPTAQEQAYANEPHTAPLAAQTQQEHLASQNHENFARVNQGKPAVAATARAGDFSSHSVIAARSAGGEYHAPTMSPKEARASAPANTGNRSGGSNQGFRSFTPPNSSNTNRSAPGNPSNEGRNNQGANNGQTPAYQPKPNNPKPQNQPQHNNPPKPHKSSPPPKKENPREQRFR